MNSPNPARGWTVDRAPRPVVLVTQVGAANGSRAAAAALACAASEPDRPALLVDLGGGRAPRPSLVSTAGARALEERLAAHLPDAGIASRGQFCQLTLPPDPEAGDLVAAALPLVRESAGVVHLPPRLLRPLLADTRIRPTAALLRADLSRDRALTALAAHDLIERGLRVAVLKRPLGWLAGRAALFGAVPGTGAALPHRLRERLLKADDNEFQYCYDERNGAERERERTPRQEGQDTAPARQPQRVGERDQRRSGK